jgi:hypothetical protein
MIAAPLYPTGETIGNLDPTPTVDAMVADFYGRDLTALTKSAWL